MEATSGTDVVAVLTKDHREVEELFAQLAQLGPGEPNRRKALTEQVITELVRHSEFVPQGDQLADRELAEHAEAERTMKELEGCDPDDARFDTLLRQLIDEIRQHVAEEEGELFPKLASHAGRESWRPWAARCRR